MPKSTPTKFKFKTSRGNLFSILTLADATHSDPGERDQVDSFYNWNMELGFIRGFIRVSLKMFIYVFYGQFKDKDVPLNIWEA